MLAYVRGLIPAHATVSVVGDSAFGAVPVLQWLDRQGWYSVLRHKGGTLVRLPHTTAWQRFERLIQHRGQRVWITGVVFTELHAYPVTVLACWEQGEPEPWLRVTNYPEQRSALRAYRKRMWVEEMFGDFKGHGVDLESTQ